MTEALTTTKAATDGRQELAPFIRNIKPRRPMYGHIKIGGVGAEKTAKSGNKYRQPVKYDGFKITTLARGDDENLVMDTEMHTLLEAFQDPDGKLRKLPIIFLSNDPSEVLKTKYVQYAGKKALCEGDGVNANERVGDTKEWKQRLCACGKEVRGYKPGDKQPCNQPCKISLDLFCDIDVKGAPGGAYRFHTSSIFSTIEMTGCLREIYDATYGVLLNMPFWLILKNGTSEDGYPFVYVSLKPRISWKELSDTAVKQLKIVGSRVDEVDKLKKATLMLTSGAFDYPDDIMEAEFYPIVEPEVVIDLSNMDEVDVATVETPTPKAKPKKKPPKAEAPDTDAPSDTDSPDDTDAPKLF